MDSMCYRLLRIEDYTKVLECKEYINVVIVDDDESMY